MIEKFETKPIRIRFHAGYRGMETPRVLHIEGRMIPVERILNRRREQDSASGRRSDVLLCRAGGKTWRIRVHEDGSATGKVLPAD